MEKMDVGGSVICPVLTGSRLPAAIMALCIALLGCGCNRYVVVTREMTWECVPAEQDINYPEAEPVLFRYTEDPEYFDLASGRALCQQLQASGKSRAEVTYQVWGNRVSGLHGYHIESVNGQPLNDIGGPAWSGCHGTCKAVHPLESALR